VSVFTTYCGVNGHPLYNTNPKPEGMCYTSLLQICSPKWR